MKSFVLLTLVLMCSGASAELPDPTRPFTVTAAADAAPGLRLEAVMRSGDKHLAIVNGELVRVGDRIAGTTIAGIGADSVRYVAADGEHVARLSGTALKVRHESAGAKP